jgi:Flp pilus assembly pilin Flp
MQSTGRASDVLEKRTPVEGFPMRHHHPARRTQKRGERGASLVEYAMLLALIAVVTFSAVSFFGAENGGGFANSASCIEKAYTAETLCP